MASCDHGLDSDWCGYRLLRAVDFLLCKPCLRRVQLPVFSFRQHLSLSPALLGSAGWVQRTSLDDLADQSRCENPQAVTQLQRLGFAVIRSLISESEASEISRRLERLGKAAAGTRRLLDESWCRELGHRLRLDARISGLLPHDARAIQCTYFAKSPARNWLVTLHQDLSIPVANRVESRNCSGWSQKEGMLFVQPPPSVLEDILAIRIHVDDCNEENGALRVVPGSHVLGRLTAEAIQGLRDETDEVIVPVSRGGGMLMRPLLLHASQKVCVDRRRRVLHFVYGPPKLPFGLR